MSYHEYRTVTVADENHRITIELPAEMRDQQVEIVVRPVEGQGGDRVHAIIDRVSRNPRGRFQTAEEVAEYISALREDREEL